MGFVSDQYKADDCVKIKMTITRSPQPPALASFVCVICSKEIKRDPWKPELEQEPICFLCSMRPRKRPQLAGVGVEQWNYFYRAQTLICAIEQESARAKRNR